MKTVLVTLSVMNMLMGLILVGLFAFTDNNPVVVLILALGLLIQGGFTLAYMSGRLRRAEPWPTHALLAGSTLALLVGAGGLLFSVIKQLSFDNTDPEYGPMAVAGLITAHAVATLYLYAVRGGAIRIESPTLD